MHGGRQHDRFIVLAAGLLYIVAGSAGRPALSQNPKRVALIPGIDSGQCNPGPGERPWLDPDQTPGCRALEVIASMTLEEKLAEFGGISGRSANERLGLVSGGGSDGPNGIATMGSGPPQARGKNVTAFTNAVTLAATRNRELAQQYGLALGEEFTGKGSNSVLGPTINIMRTWHWGRNGETFSEDPYLTAEMAVAEIKALNARKVLTVLKHYVGNNQENTRCGVLPDNAGVDARISEKALHEIYLPAFKAAVQRAGAVIEAFYPGQEAGSSIAQLQFGDVNPSGKLAMTFPAGEDQEPGTHFLDYPGDGMTVNYSEGVLVGYRWYDAKNQEPLLPFGHGLSYTTFDYSDLQVAHSSGNGFTAKVSVANTGPREGA
jgi:hypothetical protein